MKRLFSNLGDWLKSRGSGFDGVGAFLSKPVPRNVAWLHTLGSLLLMYLGFQALTGMLLGFYYSPSVHDAYQSVRYVQQDLLFGNFLLKLHRFGAGFVMVTVFLHLSRSYILGAYKSPRELLWISGLAAGVLLTLFAFTGQLLPYDQRGYWATVVGIEIASSAPVLGAFVRDLLTGGFGGIGPATLSRFYILHVCILPLTLLGLLGLHLSILQRVGSAGPTQGSPEPYRPFYPGQLLKDVSVAALGALALFLVAWAGTIADTGPADPTGSGFEPRPEWYFLAHYEILTGLPGQLKVLGTFVLPNLLLAGLLLLPFLDRSPSRALSARKLVVGLGLLVGGAVITLTAIGISKEPKQIADVATISNPMQRGRELLTEKKCLGCHTLEGEGGNKGPALDSVGLRLRADVLPDWIRNPQTMDPSTEMPAFEGSTEELQTIVTFLLAPESDRNP